MDAFPLPVPLPVSAEILCACAVLRTTSPGVEFLFAKELPPAISGLNLIRSPNEQGSVDCFSAPDGRVLVAVWKRYGIDFCRAALDGQPYRANAFTRVSLRLAKSIIARLSGGVAPCRLGEPERDPAETFLNHVEELSKGLSLGRKDMPTQDLFEIALRAATELLMAMVTIETVSFAGAVN